MNNRFCIAIRVKPMAQLFQFLAELQVVINLAIENDPRRPVLIGDWLLTTLDVDDRQPANAEPYAPIDVESILIGTSMADGFAHAREQRLVNRFRAVSNYAYNSTHWMRENKPRIARIHAEYKSI